MNSDLYLWCNKCEHVHQIELWTRNGQFKYGHCPKCLSWQYKHAVAWREVSVVNGYTDIPIDGQKYPVVYGLDLGL